MTTVTQWIEQAPADVKARFEFFDGRWQEKPMAGLLHQDHVFLITAELKRRGLRAYFDVVTHLPEIDERTGKRVEVHPDVLVIAAGNPDQGGDGDYVGVPDLVAEVVSTLSDERYDASKRPVYERNGVRHYWLVRLTGPPWSRSASSRGGTSRPPGSTSSRSRPCPSPTTCSTPEPGPRGAAGRWSPSPGGSSRPRRGCASASS